MVGSIDNMGAFKNLSMEPKPMQTTSWTDRRKIKHRLLLLVSRVGAVCGRVLKINRELNI